LLINLKSWSKIATHFRKYIFITDVHHVTFKWS